MTDMSYILIIDDEPSIQRLLRLFLEPAGYEVRTAGSAEEALAHVRNEAPLVAVCDVHLPGANGLWLADQIRSLTPTTAILLATGDPRVPPIETLRAGVIAYLLKPLMQPDLLKAVDEAVRWALEKQETIARRSRGRLLPESTVDLDALDAMLPGLEPGNA